MWPPGPFFVIIAGWKSEHSIFWPKSLFPLGEFLDIDKLNFKIVDRKSISFEKVNFQFFYQKSIFDL